MKDTGYEHTLLLKISPFRRDMNVSASLDSEPLDNMAINFECTPARPIRSLALAHGVTWWAYALNMVG